jgi:hypothetical protein
MLKESPRMDATLLNHNQARHLTTVLGLLLEDLAELAAALPPEPWADATRADIHDVGARTRRLMHRLELSLPEQTPPRQRLLAYTGAWLARLHDLRAAKLSGYGAVADDLAPVLDPGLDEIARGLERISRLAREAGEP